MIRNILQLAEILAVLFCLSSLFGQKMKFDICAVVLIIADLFLFTGINEYGFPVYLSSLAYIGLFLYCLLHYKESDKVSFVNCVISIMVIGILQLIVSFPVFYILGESRSQTMIDELIINVVILLIVISFINRINLKCISEFLLKNNRTLVIIFIFMAFILSKTILLMQKNNFVNNADYIQMIYFILLLFFAIKEWQKAKADAERKKMQLEMNELYSSAYDELITLVRERQHDMKNHISAILGMIYTIDNYDDLVQKQKEYCQEIDEKSEEAKLLLKVDNPLIAGFLYQKLQEAQKQAIKVDYKVRFSEEELSIHEYEIIEVLSVLIDNAIEALKTSEDKMKKIHIFIYDINDEVHILVSNNSRVFRIDEIQSFFKRGFSTKGEGRGIGLAKLKRRVDEKNGEIIVSNEIYDNINFLQFHVIFINK